MPFAKGLNLTTMKKIILFCITIHQHTILACIQRKEENIREGSVGNLKNQGQHFEHILGGLPGSWSLGSQRCMVQYKVILYVCRSINSSVHLSWHFTSEEIIVLSVQLIQWVLLSQSVELCKRLSTPPKKRKTFWWDVCNSSISKNIAVGHCGVHNYWLNCLNIRQSKVGF